MNIEERIQKLEAFKELIASWRKTHDLETRSLINKEKKWVKREVFEADCSQTFTVGPPPAIGGLIT